MVGVLPNGKLEGRQIIPADALLPAVTAEELCASSSAKSIMGSG
jgi:hypothetical protein